MKKENCLWELIYLKDFLWKNDLASKRIELGRLLARKFPAKGIVVPVPETAILFAQGYSLESGIPLVYAIHKKRPKIRTLFVKDRDRIMKDIFFVIPELVKNKRIVLIDETTISGSSLSIVVRRLKEAKTREIHIRIVSPIRKLCPRKDFIKGWTSIKHISDYAEYFRVDSFEFLDTETLKNFAECVHCFKEGQDEKNTMARG